MIHCSKRPLSGLIVATVLLASTPAARAEFLLGFSGPASLTGEGDSRSGSFDCVMTHSGESPGAQGWSIGVVAEQGAISEITLEGTTAKGLINQGFEDSQLTTGAGNEGAVSAVVLSFFTATTLPLNAESTIAKITVQTKAGQPLPAKVTLKYLDGLVGKGQPVLNVVTQQGVSGAVTFAPLEVAVEGGVVVPPPEDGCPVAIVDSILGQIDAPADVDAYSFGALAGTFLDIKLKVAAESPNLALELFDGEGEPIDVSAFLKAKGTSYQLKKVPLGETGGFLAQINDPDGAAGAYTLQLKGKLPKDLTKGKGEVTTETAGQIIEIPFTGLAGALFAASLSGKKGPILDVLELLDPDAAAVPFGDTLQETGGSAKIKNLTLPKTGGYLLRVQVNDAPGAVKYSWSQKAPKKQTLEECPDPE